MKLRVAISITLTFLICYSNSWINAIYTKYAKNSFELIGNLNSFESKTDTINNNDKKYKIPLSTLLANSNLSNNIIALGIGIINGKTNWRCDNFEINDTGTTSTNSFREGIHSYIFSVVPRALCPNDLIISVSRDPQNTMKQIGWKSGSLVIGHPSVISSYKTINDFFNSYIRVFFSVITLLFLFIFNMIYPSQVPGSFWHRKAMALFSIHFLASSSLFEFLIPNQLGLGFPILMGGGTSGALFLILGLVEINSEKFLIWRRKTLNKNFSRLLFPLTIITFVSFYYQVGGRVYINIQAILAIILLFYSINLKSVMCLCFSILFLSDISAAFGILPGFPTNTCIHFLFTLFVFDSIEWFMHNGKIMTEITKIRDFEQMSQILTVLCKRFGIQRLSTSLFSKDHQFASHSIEGSNATLFDQREQVTQIAASVMTSRTSLLRVKLGTALSMRLKGKSDSENIKIGSEYCVFPLVYSEKVIGVLNMTSYSPWQLGDPSQVDLLQSMVERILPKLSEVLYRRDLSPNLEEQRQILEIENKFSEIQDQSYLQMVKSLDQICETLDCKVIISRAIPSEDRLLTFSNHHYPKEFAQFLEAHSPKLSNTLVTSPANIAYSTQETVFIPDVEKMFSVYTPFLVSFLKGNHTKLLQVVPLYFHDQETPWGVIWIEFPNKLNQPESDIRDLGEFITQSFERHLRIHFEYLNTSRVHNELSQLVPLHVLQKMQRGENPREKDEGYLLNFDLKGSTKLANELGDEKFFKFMTELSALTSQNILPLHFIKQVVIWDAIIFTRTASHGKMKMEDVAAIHKILCETIASLNEKWKVIQTVGFRAVLHYGDTTRDLKEGEIKTWGVSGTALAESCKLEAKIKDLAGVILVSEACKMNPEEVIYNGETLPKKAA